MPRRGAWIRAALRDHQGQGGRGGPSEQGAKAAGHDYLAPTRPRGEAIGWHVAELIPRTTRTSRASRSTRSRPAVKEALENPRPIQRRPGGRAAGAQGCCTGWSDYKISPIHWKHVKRAFRRARAKRALSLIVDRERVSSRRFFARGALIVKESCRGKPAAFRADLWKIGTKDRAPGMKDIVSAEAAARLVQKVRAEPSWWTREEKERSKRPPPPFTSPAWRRVPTGPWLPGPEDSWARHRAVRGRGVVERGTLATHHLQGTDSVRIRRRGQKARAQFIPPPTARTSPGQARDYKTKEGAAETTHESAPGGRTLTPESVKQFLPPNHSSSTSSSGRSCLADDSGQVPRHHREREDGRPPLWRAKGERLLLPRHLKVQGWRPPPNPTRSTPIRRTAVRRICPRWPWARAEAPDLTSEQKFTHRRRGSAKPRCSRRWRMIGIAVQHVPAIISTLQTASTRP
jgi:DNA topoisomerase-1